jgi:hypothetical protein
MEIAWNNAELNKLKNMFSKQEEYLSQSTDELMKIQAELKLSQCRNFEMGSQAEEYKKELQRQLNKVALEQSYMEAEIKHN